MTDTDPNTRAASPERIELLDGWHFDPVECINPPGYMMYLRGPDSRVDSYGPWQVETARAFAALMFRQLPDAEVSDALAPDPVARSVDGWQPIETAPRSGQEVDLWKSDIRFTDCHWHMGDWLKWSSSSVDDEPHWCKISSPTHWLPLPAPPSLDASRSRQEGE